ncbi:MAG: hypothetical protein E7396_09740 [Ruminococcaceae bacterium]|nr:hypothetical protein [Oscillospiraceae bacterium]
MNGLKKINLLPIEIKNKYANKFLKIFAGMIAAVMVLIMIVQVANIGFLTLRINYYKDRNAKYEQEKKNIEDIQNRIISYNAYIDEYEREVFPFERFMNDLENIRPENVYIISVDTSDRLINEGKQDDETKDKIEADKEENKETSDGELESIKEKNFVVPEIKYVGDLVGKDIVIRGYSKRQDEISAFIFELSKLSYITEAKITAIEEHEMLDGQEYNIFEIVIKGGTYIENHNEG